MISSISLKPDSSDYVIVILLMIYGKEPLGLREYGNVFGYLIAVVSVVIGTVSKDMIVMVMVGFQVSPRPYSQHYLCAKSCRAYN